MPVEKKGRVAGVYVSVHVKPVLDSTVEAFGLLLMMPPSEK